MGLRSWLRSILGRGPQSGMVPFLDVENGRVVQIPVSELVPGSVQVRLRGHDGVVWALPSQLQPGPIKHPEFDENTRECIRQIQSAFAEHRPISFEEWEEGFRRDTTPEREIALWSHAADVYTAFAGSEPSADRRRDVYLCVTTCLIAGPYDVWHVLRPQVLTRLDAQKIVDRFYGKAAG
jgi:hypothetical protein